MKSPRCLPLRLSALYSLHREAANWLDAVDIYVSLNMFGGLSNANLEAIAAGKCMIMLAPDPARHIDEETDEIIPADAVIRIGRDDITGNLARTLEDLIAEPTRIQRLAANTAALADRTLDDWSQRIAREIEIIRSA